MSNDIYNEPNDINKLCMELEKIANAAASTQGPYGHLVIIDEGGSVIATKDGATVVNKNSSDTADPIFNAASRFAKDAVKTSNEEAGDGTTATIVILRDIIRKGKKYINTCNPRSLQCGMKKASNIVVSSARQKSTSIRNNFEQIKKTATISANGDQEVGDMIAKALQEAGANGVVTIEKAKSAQTTMNTVSGMHFDRGFISPYFAMNAEKKGHIVLENPFVLICNQKVTNLSQILTVLEGVASSGKPLLIIAEDVEGEALSALILNHLGGKIKVCAIKAPGFGDNRTNMLEDIAILTGTQVIDGNNIELKNATVDNLGRAGKIHVTKDHTTILECNPNEDTLNARIAEINDSINDSDSDYEKEKLRERLAKLCASYVVINVGSDTEVAALELKDRYTDALCATQAAIADGIVVGGGCALLYSYPDLISEIEKETNEDTRIGMKIVAEALKAPIRQILTNAGFEASVIINKLINGGDQNVVFDVSLATSNNSDDSDDSDGSKYVNAHDAGIIDPLKVVLTALNSAISVGSIILTSSTMILPSKKENKNDSSSASSMGMGGMNPYGDMGY